jgi:Holliday junction resolvasome RuvABC endonuclease subunit
MKNEKLQKLYKRIEEIAKEYNVDEAKMYETFIELQKMFLDNN